MQFRRNTAAGAATNNRTLLAGEPGFTTDTDVLKIGDGVTPWNSLSAVGGDTLVTLANNHGAKCDGVTDDTAAIQDLLDDGLVVGIKGTALISAPLVMSQFSSKLHGVGGWGYANAKARIVSTNLTEPVVVMDAPRFCEIRDLAIEHSSAATSVDAFGIMFTGQVGQSSFHNLFLRNNGIGMGCEQGVTNSVYSSIFTNIRVNNYGVSGLDFRTASGGGTGCVWDVVYVNAGGDIGAGPTPLAAPVRIRQMHDWKFSGLHIEGTSASTGLEIDNCYGFRVDSVHFEQFTGLAAGGALIRIVGGNANTVTLGSVDVYGCYFLGANGTTSFYVVRNDSAATGQILVGQIHVSSTTDVTGCSLYPLGAFGGAKASVAHALMEVGLDRPNYTAGDLVAVRHYNGIDAWRTGGDPLTPNVNQLRECWRTVAQGAPTTGAWRIGDKVWFSNPTAGGFVGMICTTAGTPGTWKTFGAITA